MTEHQKLQAICEKIGYELFRCDIDEETGVYYTSIGGYHELDVREIIFTQEFMDLFLKYLYRKSESKNLNEKCFTRVGITSTLCMNLDNPVDYIYDLIF